MKLRHLDRKEDGGARSLKIEQQKRKYKAQRVKITWTEKCEKTISYNSFN